MILPLLTLVVALLSACVARRRLFPSAKSVLGYLVVMVLFVFYHLFPIHIVAGAEIAGLIDDITFPALLVVGVLGLLATFAIPSRREATATGNGDGAESSSDRIRLSWYLIALIAICAASGLVFIVNAVASYAFGWDGLTYHLPLAVSWLQDHSLAIPAPGMIPAAGAWQYSLPANGNAGLMVLLAAGLERFAFAPNLLAYAVLALSTYLLACQLTADRMAALLAAILFVTVPIVQFQATSAYIDLYGSSFILAGAALFASRNHASNGPAGSRWYAAAIALAGLAWGIAIGTKPIFYAYAGLSATGALIIIWRECQGRRRSAVALAALIICTMLLPSAFWFLRALEATGNPIYPIPVRIMGWTIFEGYSLDSITRGNPERRFVTSTLGWFVYPWVEYKNNGHPYGVTSGLGAAWASFVPLGVAYAFYYWARNIDRSQARYCAVMLLYLIVLLVLWWFALRRFPRFGLPILAIGCVLTAPLFAFLRDRHEAALKTLFMLSIVTTLTVSTFIPAHEFLGKARDGVWSRTAVFEMPDLFDRMPAGTVVWNAGAWETWNFALAGARLSNKVIFRRCWRVPDFGKFIAEHQIDYVVEFTPYRCGEIRNLNVRRAFEGRVGPTLKWRVWAVSEKARATVR